MRRLPVLLIALAAGCDSPAAPPAAGGPPGLPEGPGTRVLFLGNSLTSGNDLAGLVKAMAAAGGVELQVFAVAPGGVNLEDHWTGGHARPVVARGRWDFVVLQQGPSSRPESRADLKKWAVEWADEVRRHEAEPALYMVWPYQSQGDRGFELVSQSYRAAAEAAGAKVLPAGDAWRAALAADPGIDLFGDDAFHPTPAGSYLAALVIASGLTGVDPAAVPAKLTLGSGEVVEITDAQAAMFRKAVAAVKPQE